ncbi:MAG: glycosyltransferase family 2 protein [Nitrospirae bacterium]|nr:glycosyltransferase family 2 protein [Nitrospirota bacterium]
MTPEVSIIIVNYRAAEFVIRCVDSILAGDADRVEVIVVDNFSTREETQRLEILTDSGVRLILNADNQGFASACNKGVRASAGKYIMFLNPDTIVFDDCVRRLVDSFDSNRDAGAVGPRTWWDSARTMQLIQQHLPSPYLSIVESLSGLKYIHRTIDRAILRRDYLYSSTTTPLSVQMLPGSAILTSRAILQRLGPFDEGYPLYFEDSDWCRRLKQRGLNLYMVPDAQICHFYNQSARTDSGGASDKFAASAERYMARHHSPLSRLAATYISRATSRLKADSHPPDLIDLGVIGRRPSFSSGKAVSGRLLFQLSVNTVFLPSAIALVDKPKFQLPQEVWSYLSAGVYYARIVQPHPYKTLDTWQFIR